MFYSFGPTLAVIFYCIECSSQSDLNPYEGRNSGPSSNVAGKHHPLDQTLIEQPPFRSRSRSPSSRSLPIKILGYSLEKLGYMRLISRTNQNLQFEFRNYILAPGTLIKWRAEGNIYSTVPAREYIVLSTSHGEIFAILANSGFLLGIYSFRRLHPRVKMNMLNGRIDDLTTNEKKDCPVGSNRPIFPQNFMKAFANDDSLKFKWHPNSDFVPASSSPGGHLPDRSSTPQESIVRARSISPPGKPPSDTVLGFSMEKLGYVRLIPRKNPNLRFEFRRYVFPTDKRIRMRQDNINYIFGSTQEYIVVSASNGDVFAILDHGGFLRAIYRSHTRVKINMISGAVDDMTPDEKIDCPVGERCPIFPNMFICGFSYSDSLQSARNPNDKRDSAHSSAPRQHSPDRTSPEEPSSNARSSSPLGKPPSREVLGYTLAQLGYIRLIPQMNPHRQFEFRRYVFPPYRGISVMTGHGKYASVPDREHIVLSTSSGDVFAILEYTGILRAIFLGDRGNNWSQRRIRMNMLSGEVDRMTEFEMKECRVGKTFPIFPRWFNKVVSNEDSLQYVYH